MIMFVYPKRNNNFTPIFFVRLVITQFTADSSNTNSNRYQNKKIAIKISITLSSFITL